ncbi:MAG: hypothetical protein PVG39_12530 [Desulfobacteraceae bacterium]|jgi:hypothetical protein
MDVIKKIIKSEWVTRFSRKTERRLFFAMTILMLIWGILDKIGVIQG